MFMGLLVCVKVRGEGNVRRLMLRVRKYLQLMGVVALHKLLWSWHCKEGDHPGSLSACRDAILGDCNFLASNEGGAHPVVLLELSRLSVTGGTHLLWHFSTYMMRVCASGQIPKQQTKRRQQCNSVGFRL